MKRLQIILVLFLSLACAKTKQEKLHETIEQANYFLTNQKCDDAIEILEDFGIDKTSADFMKVYSSAYACKAGFSMLDLFNIDINTISASSLLTSLASLSSSDEVVPDSSQFLALERAIEIITESQKVNSNANAAKRISYYGRSKGIDINFQATLMIIIQLGKFFKLYGDADATGVKGSQGNNSCLYSYTHANAVSTINSVKPGSCVSATGSEGSEFLEAPVTAALTKKRMCYGLVLFNNLIDTLGSLSLSSSQYGELDDIKDLVDTSYSAIITAEASSYGTTIVNDLKGIRTQNLCEDLNLNEVERYYAFFLENLYQ